jgi:exonuclease SbcC
MHGEHGMNPLRIVLENVRTWERLDLALPEGCLAIVGANGAGKSTILNAIDLALFGGRDLGRCLTRGDEDTMRIELEFEHAGARYRVRRTYTSRGRGSTKVDFERRYDVLPAGDRWHSFTRESASETQAAIEATIGLSRDTFRASAFLAQGDGAAFTDAQPRDRKAILAEVLGLDLYDKLYDETRADRSATEGELQKIAGALEADEHELLDKPEVVKERDRANSELDETKVRIAEAEEHLLHAETRVATAREAKAARDAATTLAIERGEYAERIAADVVALSTEIAGIEVGAEEKPQLQATSEPLPNLEQQQRALIEQRQAWHLCHADRERAAEAQRDLELERQRKARERDALAQALATDRDTFEALARDETPHCPICKQEVADEALAATKETLLAGIQQAGERIETLAAEVTELNKRHAEFVSVTAQALPPEPTAPESLDAEIARARKARQDLAVLEAQAGRLPDLQSKLDELLGVRATANAALVEAQAALHALREQSGEQSLDDLLAHREAAASAVASWQTRLKGIEHLIVRCDERLERFALLEARIAERADARSRLLREVDLLARLEKAYGRDGIPALIVENSAIPQIESEADRIVQALGRSYSFELRTQRENKTGGTRDALDIVIHTETGESMYEDFSGGERSRINLALRIALARLLAHRRGADVRLLAIDEPDGLDAEGFEQLAGVLRELTAEFTRVVVVSHHPDLRDAFDQSITVVGGGGSGEPSRIAGVAEPAEVAEVAA